MYDPGMPVTGHQISSQRLEEFRRIYKEAYGEELTLAVAREMANRLITLYKLIMQPVPGEKNVPSSASPAQSVEAKS